MLADTFQERRQPQPSLEVLPIRQAPDNLPIVAAPPTRQQRPDHLEMGADLRAVRRDSRLRRRPLSRREHALAWASDGHLLAGDLGQSPAQDLAVVEPNSR